MEQHEDTSKPAPNSNSLNSQSLTCPIGQEQSDPQSSSESGTGSPDSQIYLEPEDGENERNVPGATKAIQKFDSKKKKYHSIPDDIRLKLIDAVENKGEKIKHVRKPVHTKS